MCVCVRRCLCQSVWAHVRPLCANRDFALLWRPVCIVWVRRRRIERNRSRRTRNPFEVCTYICRDSVCICVAKSLHSTLFTSIHSLCPLFAPPPLSLSVSISLCLLFSSAFPGSPFSFFLPSARFFLCVRRPFSTEPQFFNQNKIIFRTMQGVAVCGRSTSGKSFVRFFPIHLWNFHFYYYISFKRNHSSHVCWLHAVTFRADFSSPFPMDGRKLRPASFGSVHSFFGRITSQRTSNARSATAPKK